MFRRPLLECLLALGLALAPAVLIADTPADAARATLEVPLRGDTLHVELIAPNIVHLSYRTQGQAAAPTLLIDPAWQPKAPADVRRDASGNALSTATLRVQWEDKSHALAISGADGRTLLRVDDPAALAHGELSVRHGAGQPLYGVGGYDAFQTDVSAGLLRQGQLRAEAGQQGNAGAPLVWSTAGYGVLLDALGADVRLDGDRIALKNTHARDAYLIVGRPAAIFAGIAQLSGRTPLFPKWAMGFTNSQWGIDEKELLAIVEGYRSRHIPLDNFTLDFDWKAWGEDWGEFRWNENKFPDGPSGKLKAMLDPHGVHLTGIMKPRIHVDTVEGRYATAHGFWAAASQEAPDYFSKKPVRELDFDKPEVRAWFFNDHLKHSFDTGIVGWWNDEADDIGSNTQFTNMQRAMYEGQRAHSPLRVWSINRNFYLGAQRYAYGLWSGDIPTGFASMAGQRARMLSAIDVGAMQWGMDGGGFKDGTPTPENYARWVQFGAFTPIFRVHGVLGQKRQPWVYGPVAEKAASAAIRLRQSLVPYIYSYEYARRTGGVGLVRPLFFDWPDDANLRNDVEAWLFGDWLLVSPVVEQGQREKAIYLPAGDWLDWFTGERLEGGRRIVHHADAEGWSDIPLYVREGAIIPMQAPEDYVGQHPLSELTVEIFPAARESRFTYYDDDGSTYAYERGEDFRQTFTVRRDDDGAHVDLAATQGAYRPALKTYLLRVHGIAAVQVADAAGLKRYDDPDTLQKAAEAGWASGRDRFGEVTWIRLPAGDAHRLLLTP
ncbi:TIM-barrel domain-containing protein [Aerosticca soli]|uniref:Alpha-glucosidase n=1 Tax=Aerosticca soli TaxID=2010829 RepID=A0A2Z6E5R0_9GAMM|nr:TIM-barrel domain-containing protein [Aerosticca soli]MDI3261388.1 glycoside hydrolase family 31 protein [Fulvimonas sp.]BBD80440.1 alpha-glucosidase [Aerosticca soli]